MSKHILKIDRKWFDRLADGSKTAEVRKHDRDFQIGDLIVFIATDDFSYRVLSSGVNALDATISHILPASVVPTGINTGHSVLSLNNVRNIRTLQEGEEP